jgi:hypothetical protein
MRLTCRKAPIAADGIAFFKTNHILYARLHEVFYRSDTRTARADDAHLGVLCFILHYSLFIGSYIHCM